MRTEIELTRGLVAVIDEADAPLVAAHSWYAHAGSSGFYAAYKTPAEGYVPMHRVILGTAKGDPVDHRDGDTLNNRRSNLRPATSRLNARNRRPVGEVPFAGVTRVAHGYQALIHPDGLHIALGVYRTELEAAAVYNAAAIRIYGEFARLNAVGPDPAGLEAVIRKRGVLLQKKLHFTPDCKSVQRLRAHLAALGESA